MLGCCPPPLFPQVAANYSLLKLPGVGFPLSIPQGDIFSTGLQAIRKENCTRKMRENYFRKSTILFSVLFMKVDWVVRFNPFQTISSFISIHFQYISTSNLENLYNTEFNPKVYLKFHGFKIGSESLYE